MQLSYPARAHYPILEVILLYVYPQKIKNKIMFLIHKRYILFATFFSYLLFLELYMLSNYRSSSFFLNCGTEVGKLLNYWPQFSTILCWSLPQGFTKLCNSKYNLHSLILDFFFLCFFKAYFFRMPV